MRWIQTRSDEQHGLAWRVANIVLFVLALLAAAAVIVGVWVGILVLASQGS